ncbi:sucrase ferredoxin [Saccharothrix yanglingensis]|uniref:Sucrase ferredoxin n=1 Tax=Saccharothrix yanglingensis TaxID=659496 RepID=A0ABU0XAW3_9PSEU|nr:sucrase ferredoxin [Saccharothrix yanglingensis]MDQ2588843.1 sucrase ferredoxin [Saccharothrix yanglingensis]
MTEPRCAAISATLDDPQAGTAATAAAWLALEQPGPWGRDALTQSRLDPAIGAELARRAADAGVRVLLIRRPGRHTDAPGAPRRVYLATTAPGASRLSAGHVVDPAGLLDLDLGALARGEDTGFGSPAAHPVLLVCANSRRDTCCALLGRPLAGELAAERGEAVWECTHTGGHRFAPTGVLLPTGYTYGRLDADFARLLLDRAAAGHVVTDRCRGRSTHGPAGQVADLAVRELTGEHRDALAVVGETPHGVTVRHDDGRAWHVAVTTRELPARPVSCGANPTAPTAVSVTGVRPLVPAGG